MGLRERIVRQPWPGEMPDPLVVWPLSFLPAGRSVRQRTDAPPGSYREASL